MHIRRGIYAYLSQKICIFSMEYMHIFRGKYAYSF